MPNVSRHAAEASHPPPQQPPQHAPATPFQSPPLHPFGDEDAFGDTFNDGVGDDFGDAFGDAGAGDERLLEEVELRAASANFPRRHALALIRHDSDPAALPGRTVRSFSAGAARSRACANIMRSCGHQDCWVGLSQHLADREAAVKARRQRR